MVALETSCNWPCTALAGYRHNTCVCLGMHHYLYYTRCIIMYSSNRHYSSDCVWEMPGFYSANEPIMPANMYMCVCAFQKDSNTIRFEITAFIIPYATNLFISQKKIDDHSFTWTRNWLGATGSMKVHMYQTFLECVSWNILVKLFPNWIVVFMRCKFQHQSDYK